MRHFYIFKINPTLEKLWKRKPYELFHTLETIYYRDEDDIYLGNCFLNQIIKPIASKELNTMLFQHYKNNYFYMKYQNTHSIHDVYRHEKTILSVHKTYLKLDTNVIKPSFFNIINKFSHFFICDFEQKDYFWLEALENDAIFI